MPAGGFFHQRLTVDNTVTAVKTTVSILDSYANQTDTDVLVPYEREISTYHADGNLFADRIWTYGWDGGNRLIAMTFNKLEGGRALACVSILHRDITVSLLRSDAMVAPPFWRATLVRSAIA